MAVAPRPVLPLGTVRIWQRHCSDETLKALLHAISGGFQRQGGRLKINATVDAEGIAHLKEVLHKYEEILKLL